MLARAHVRALAPATPELRLCQMLTTRAFGESFGLLSHPRRMNMQPANRDPAPRIQRPGYPCIDVAANARSRAQCPPGEHLAEPDVEPDVEPAADAEPDAEPDADVVGDATRQDA